MSNSHGDLFTEIGKLVVAVNMGQAIDLDATAKDLAKRYQHLDISEATFVKIVSRSIGAVRLSLAGASPQAKLPDPPLPAPASSAPLSADGAASVPPRTSAPAAPASGSRRTPSWLKAKSSTNGETGTPAKSPFPSGVRLAVLS
jgi:hypothetical protein